MTSTFNFAIIGCEYIHNITTGIVLHLCRTSHSVASLYLTDENNNGINFPEVFTIYTKDFQTNKYVPIKPIENIYALCYTDDYSVYFNSCKVLDIKSKREWDIIVS